MIFDETLKYYVNLDSRPDRRQRMEETLSKAGIQAERVRGIPYRELDLTNPKYQKMKARTPGAIGCMLSQMSCMFKALEQNKDLLIMEDDLEISSDFSKRIKIIEKFTSESLWDVFWLGGTVHINPPEWHKVGHNDELTDCTCTNKRDATPVRDKEYFLKIIRTYGAFSTYAYIINKNSLSKIIKMLYDYMGNTIGIDHAFIKLQPELLTYMFLPGCVRQYDNQSDIGNGITRFSGFSMLGSYWYQDKMENFDNESLRTWAGLVP
jgi:GR25 family glycosyltransferase involved in LPS biosynthesis